MNKKTIAIIPCAGLGTRMGMLPHEAKEMLPDKAYNYTHMIDYPIDICNQYNLDPLFISREEKTTLNDYLYSKGKNVLIIKPEGEWNSTVLASKDHWRENNILLLPDTRFFPQSTIENIQTSLELGNQAVLALHEVKDPKNWGVVQSYKIIEKPKDLEGPQMAWGLIGFKKSYGEQLFQIDGKKLENTGFTFLEFFEDISRKR